MNAITPPSKADLDAALDWWRLAGVSHDFAEDATDWLAPDEPAAPVSQPQDRARAEPQAPEIPAPAQIDLLGDSPPGDLAAFREFWLQAPGLDAIGPRGRVPPRGPASPELMVLVMDPEQSDSDHLLSGPQGRLLARIIAAMNLSEDSVYFASALPRHTPMADASALVASGMEKVTLHHVNLVDPQRVLAFGSNIPPLLGHALTKDIFCLREINQKTRSIPLLVTEALDSMMSMPRLKARFWRRWIEWSGK